jgi:hypothetical protein
MRKILPLSAVTALAMACGLSLAHAAQDPPTDAPPADPGMALVLQKCGSCHPVSTVTDTKQSAAAWSDTVDEMVQNGAELSADENAQLKAYLAKTLAPPATPAA